MRCSDVRGFNYSGSWGTSGLDLWLHHDHGTMAIEVARAKGYFPKWNLVRWWLADEAFHRNPKRFMANFGAGLSIFDSHDILVMPVLFNRWRDPICDFGGVSLEHIVPGLGFISGLKEGAFSISDEPRELSLVETLHSTYLEAVVGNHRDDKRIFAWDLCNEPFMGAYVEDASSQVRAAELRWLTWIHAVCKRVGATQPLTIGNYPFQRDVMELTESLSDFLSFHPYYAWNVPGVDRARYESQLDEAVEFARRAGKELLASETVWGAVDDDQRVKVLRYTLEQLCMREIGFAVHALQHSLVADLHFPAYGPIGNPESMHFVNPDGSLRHGHEAFNDFC